MASFHCFHVMLLLIASVDFNVSATASEYETSSAETGTVTLKDRVERLERALLEQHSSSDRQEKTIGRLEKEKRHLQKRVLLLEERVTAMEENEEMTSSKCPSSEVLQTDASKQPSGDRNQGFQNQPQNASTEQSNQRGHLDSAIITNAVRRSDDLDRPWEPVLSHMNQQLAEMTSQIQTLKNADLQHDQAIQNSQSSLYVRWGRSSCPPSSHLVYSGVIGGSNYRDTGGATDFLCLSMSPVGGSIQRQSYHAYLYGAELETYDNNDDKDPLCAVCRVPRATTVMLPGTNKCLSGWMTEYTGYLMTGYTSSGAGSEYVCVDAHPDVRHGSESDQNGKLLYYTYTVCGSLPCPPYTDDTVVTCAVCSK